MKRNESSSSVQNYFHLDSLQKKLKDLEEENVVLRSEVKCTPCLVTTSPLSLAPPPPRPEGGGPICLSSEKNHDYSPTGLKGDGLWESPPEPGVTDTPGAQWVCLIYKLGIAFQEQHVLPGCGRRTGE